MRTKSKYSEGASTDSFKSTPLYYFLKPEEQLDDFVKSRERFTSTPPTLLFDKKFEQRFTLIEERVRNVEKSVFKKATQITSTKIHDLASDNYELNDAIDVVLKYEDDEVIAVVPELELHADGRNEIEAVNELKLELLDLFDDLNNLSDEELHATPKSWKKIINKLIIKNGD